MHTLVSSAVPPASPQHRLNSCHVRLHLRPSTSPSAGPTTTTSGRGRGGGWVARGISCLEAAGLGRGRLPVLEQAQVLQAGSGRDAGSGWEGIEEAQLLLAGERVGWARRWLV